MVELTADEKAEIERRINAITPEEWRRMTDKLYADLRQQLEAIERCSRLTDKDWNIRITI